MRAGRRRHRRLGSSLPTFEQGEKVRRASPSRRPSTHRSMACPACWPAPPTSPATPGPSSPVSKLSRSNTPAVGRCTTASASTPWARQWSAWPSMAASFRPVARSSSSSTTCAPASGWHRSATPRSSSCGRTIPWVSARTGRRTNRSSSSRRCAIPHLQVIRPADANETVAAWKPPSPTTVPRRWCSVVRPSRCAPTARRSSRCRWSVGPNALRSCSSAPAAKCRCASRPTSSSLRRHPGQRGQHAVVGSLRRAGRRLPGRRASRRFARPVGRSRCHVRWERYADESIGIDRFGASAPGNVVMDKLGINVANVVAAATRLAQAKG